MNPAKHLSALIPLVFLPTLACAAAPSYLEEVLPMGLDPVVNKAIYETGALAKRPMPACACDASVDQVTWQGKPVALIDGVSLDISHFVHREGPVTALNADGSARCTAEVENLHAPFVLANGRYFYFVSADGIDFQIQAVDLKDCSISWKSPSFYWEDDYNPQYKDGRYQIVKKGKKTAEYAIQSNGMVQSKK